MLTLILRCSCSSNAHVEATPDDGRSTAHGAREDDVDHLAGGRDRRNGLEATDSSHVGEMLQVSG